MEQNGGGDAGAKKNIGRKKVSAVIGASVARLEHRLDRQARRADPVWPARGMPLDGVPPGAWKTDGPIDETGHLPASCPVRPLGYEGENYSFVDTSGQVFNTGTNALGVERVQKLFAGHEQFLEWAWPSYGRSGKKITGFKAEEARRDLYAACRERGPWSATDRVRGRGAWLDADDRLVLHCGDYLWIPDGKGGGRLEETGELGDHFYVRRPASLVPAPQPVGADINPAIEIVEMLRTWNFERGDTDVLLFLGWIGTALMGAALDWRPSIFVVGDAGTGKSELTGRKGLMRAILGRSMLSTTNASEAGLYQVVGHDSLPIAIDELESDDNQEQAQKIIKMARDAASGSIRIRGGSDHKGVEFAAQSTFSFSAINPPGIPPASLSRLAILQLNPLKSTTGRVPRLKAAETVGPRLLRRITDHFDDFRRIGDPARGTADGLYEIYRTALRDHGHNSRGQNTFGTFLAAAHLLLGDEGMDAAGLSLNPDHWGEMLRADAVPELEDVKPTWLDCMEKILTRPIDQFHGGQRPTPARILQQLRDNDMTIDAARQALAAVDLGLVDGEHPKAGYMLAVPNRSDVLAKHLAGTSYVGSWSWALRRAPEPVRIVGQDNRVSIAGLQRRCTLIRIREVNTWLKNHG